MSDWGGHIQQITERFDRIYDIDRNMHLRKIKYLRILRPRMSHSNAWVPIKAVYPFWGVNRLISSPLSQCFAACASAIHSRASLMGLEEA